MPEAAEWWDKISAVATFAATAVALWIAVGEGMRRRRDQADADAAQARMVVLHRTELGFTVVNYSGLPLLGTEIVRATYVEPQGKRWTPLVGKELDVSPGADMVAPNGKFAVTVQQFQVEGTGVVFPGKRHDKADDLECTYRFTDAQGLRWERTNLEPPRRVIDQRQRWWRRT